MKKIWHVKGRYGSGKWFKRDRDDQLKTILGEVDKYEEVISSFRAKFDEIAEDTQGKRYIMSNLKIIGLNKKDFSNMATSSKDYLLFEVSNTLEWYQTLLRCHNFVSIPKYYYKRGKGKLETEQTRLDNFKEAKESLKKKTTRKNKETV